MTTEKQLLQFPTGRNFEFKHIRETTVKEPGWFYTSIPGGGFTTDDHLGEVGALFTHVVFYTVFMTPEIGMQLLKAVQNNEINIPNSTLRERIRAAGYEADPEFVDLRYRCGYKKDGRAALVLLFHDRWGRAANARRAAVMLLEMLEMEYRKFENCFALDRWGYLARAKLTRKMKR